MVNPPPPTKLMKLKVNETNFSEAFRSQLNGAKRCLMWAVYAGVDFDAVWILMTMATPVITDPSAPWTAQDERFTAINLTGPWDSILFQPDGASINLQTLRSLEEFLCDFEEHIGGTDQGFMAYCQHYNRALQRGQTSQPTLWRTNRPTMIGRSEALEQEFRSLAKAMTLILRGGARKYGRIAQLGTSQSITKVADILAAIARFEGFDSQALMTRFWEVKEPSEDALVPGSFKIN